MKERILIVDDDPLFRRMLAEHLEFDDYPVEAVDGAQSALRYMARHPVEIVVLDIQMPGMNGLDLLREVRRQYPMKRVIMVTGFVNQANVLTCMRLGADTCLFKPIGDLREVSRAVGESAAILQRWHDILVRLKEMRLDRRPEETHE